MARVKAEVPREAGVGGGGGIVQLEFGAVFAWGKKFFPPGVFCESAGVCLT